MGHLDLAAPYSALEILEVRGDHELDRLPERVGQVGLQRRQALEDLLGRVTRKHGQGQVGSTRLRRGEEEADGEEEARPEDRGASHRYLLSHWPWVLRSALIEYLRDFCIRLNASASCQTSPPALTSISCSRSPIEIRST